MGGWRRRYGSGKRWGKPNADRRKGSGKPGESDDVTCHGLARFANRESRCSVGRDYKELLDVDTEEPSPPGRLRTSRRSVNRFASGLPHGRPRE
jgi:hypothetical protein